MSFVLTVLLKLVPQVSSSQFLVLGDASNCSIFKIIYTRSTASVMRAYSFGHFTVFKLLIFNCLLSYYNSSKPEVTVMFNSDTLCESNMFYGLYFLFLHGYLCYPSVSIFCIVCYANLILVQKYGTPLSLQLKKNSFRK